MLWHLCARLKTKEQGARVLVQTLRRVDQASQQVELRLARPLREAEQILPLFERGSCAVDAGYGIDQLRLEAVQVEGLPVRQMSHAQSRMADGASGGRACGASGLSPPAGACSAAGRSIFGTLKSGEGMTG